MPVSRRPPMPKLPPFALADVPAPGAKVQSYFFLAVFFVLFAGPLFVMHLWVLQLPFFWDEHGQFIPTALDLLRTNSWIAHSTTPNVHPPGVELYLVFWYKLFGFSILITRIAMLTLAAAGLLITFLLSIELSRGTDGAPAFLPPLFLLASPLFFTQSMMAQLDMPAMVLTALGLLLFLKARFPAAAFACVALVLAKETGIVVPAVFFVVLARRREWRQASYFVAPAAVLAAWLIFLRANTGYWLGNPGFAQYNVTYSLSPVRIVFSFARRFYYLFFAEFRWIGTVVLLLTARRCAAFRQTSWQIAFAAGALTLILVSVLGGAELERYLLPVLLIFYIAVSLGLTMLPRIAGLVATTALLAGLVVNLFWNPPYPFPYENNFAMVDFVQLQQAAAHFAEREMQGRVIATAWPYSSALSSSDYGFVDRKLQVLETPDFHRSTIGALPPESFDALITYTRTWAPSSGVIAWPWVRRFLSRFYEWEPDITPAQCEALGLEPVASWKRHGQQITVYVRPHYQSGRARAL